MPIDPLGLNGCQQRACEIFDFERKPLSKTLRVDGENLNESMPADVQSRISGETHALFDSRCEQIGIALAAGRLTCEDYCCSCVAVAELPELPDGSALELHLRTPEEARGGPVAWWVTADGRWAWRVVPASA